MSATPAMPPTTDGVAETKDAAPEHPTVIIPDEEPVARVAPRISAEPKDILLSGWLKKQGTNCLRRWQRRWFVLFHERRELRYYTSVREASFGQVPIEDRGAINVDSIVRIEAPQSGQYGGCRFNIVFKRYGKSRYPGAFGPEDVNAGFQYMEHTWFLFAPDALTRHTWISTLNLLREGREAELATALNSVVVNPIP